MQVQLDDETALSLRLLALRVGMPAEDVARLAVADFLRRNAGA